MPSTGHQSHARVLTPELKRGDQLPDLAIQVTSELGPVDVSDASRVRVLGRRDGRMVIDRDAQGGADGVVTMPWELSDVSVGVVGFEVEITWTGRRRTFPSSGLVWVRINQDVDGSDSALIEDPPGSGLYRLIDVFTLTGPGLYSTGPLTESPAGSGLYGLDYTPGS